MEQPTSRIRRIRRTAAIGTVTALAVAALATASATLHGPTSATPGAGAFDPGTRALAEAADGLTACRIRAETGVQMSEGIPTPPGYVRSTGVIRALNLMIDFPDAPGEVPAMRRFAEFFPQTADWFHVSSYGRLRYVPHTPVPTWLRMPLPFPEYGLDRGAPYEPGYRKLVEHIVEAADEHVDFSTYDLVNVLVTPNAGPSALDTVLSVTFSGNGEAPSADGVALSNTSFVYSRQDDGSGSFHETGYRVLPHENGHVFGLPDLYTVEGGAAVGHWDIMSEDWGANNDLLGWHKWKLGWLDDGQVRCASERGTREYALTPLAREGGGVKLAVVPLGDLAGYVLEVRTREGNDEAVCDPGVLVYRVRTDVDTGQGPVTVEDGEPGSGGCTRRPNVHAELSDAPYGPGETFHDEAAGVAVTVLSRERNGTYRVRVTRS
ncbi:M6 family metalloprotease domain-containing protein [Streptomyces somaliensis DSM 40738]|uniref:M6 family metalloprotease domain-containing protein n=1 Tax=Streptomyces somaliensis (strain ATCC 33201 / DSM 40738 / JCM 12659 / KCTC 9044 / NCTC 11332 / NRRL B-12077 / IP 733) TaxID=1134445 RepID=A0AA44DAL9_STRE0|nr:M6 family metalloprotease domain-containing protein [Streptomyces somaliensis]MCQ0023135.1 M6 family metalloprotease domain-containing protein [Streptomyces somaliensis DSM 40738]NKY13261.1 M6 family metalloprotease domain-containing protein [Streptomyces somaliensis DSM 40738]